MKHGKRCYNDDHAFCSLIQGQQVKGVVISREKDFDKNIGLFGRYVIPNHPVAYHFSALHKVGGGASGSFGKDWESSIEHFMHLVNEHNAESVDTISYDLAQKDTYPFYQLDHAELLELKNMLAVASMFK